MANFTSEAIGHQKFVAQCNQMENVDMSDHGTW